MRKGFSIYIFAGLAVVFSLALVPNQALALSEASATPSTSYGGRDAEYEISMKLGASVVLGGRIGIIFPNSFRFSATTTEDVVASGSMTVASGSIATATVIARADDQTLTLWLGGDGVSGVANDHLKFGVLSIANPAAGGSITLGIQNIGSDGVVDEEASSTAFSITAVNAEESQTQTPSVTVTPPSSKVTSPTAGQAIAADQDYTIKGTAADLGLHAVSKVEVSVDGGSTWNTATTLTKVSNSNFTWEYVWTDPAQGSYSVRTRATDTAGNVEELKTGISFTVSAAAPASTPTPAAPGTIQSLQLQVVALQQQVVALLQQVLSLLQSRL